MRATNGVARRARKKRILKLVKGYWGRRHSLQRIAIEAVHNADKSATRDRKRRKRDFRRLWITRISAACRPLGMSYSRLIAGLAKGGVAMDRKALSELAIASPAGFAAVVEKAKAAL
jgi:large subunit ribosomal protein L20